MNRVKIRNARNISLVLGIALVLLGMLLGVFMEDHGSTGRVHHHQVDTAPQELGTPAQENMLTVEESFASHLPLVVIDVGGENIKAGVVYNKETNTYTPVDFDPYEEGTITIIDQPGQINKLSDAAALESKMKIRLRGNFSLSFRKKQYFVKLLNEDGDKNAQDVLGMGRDWEWILNVSYIDKSLMRNYLSLNTAAEVMPNVPDMRYCEVIIKNGKENQYQGVYMMMESVKQGPDRVNITPYDPHYTDFSYLLRRDRYDSTGTMLHNFANKHELLYGWIDVKYPTPKNITPEIAQQIESEINRFEEALFAEDPQQFLTYRDYIDMQSFLDYFLINEFFANYDAGNNSTYLYKNGGGKLTMGPVWDFDGAIDNYHHQPLYRQSMAMYERPWFRQLMRDKDFVAALIKRYAELRKDVLSDERIGKYIDETAAFLGEAQRRDWARWGDFYINGEFLYPMVGEDGVTYDRNTKTYEDETNKLKVTLRDHAAWMDENLNSLYRFGQADSSDGKNAWLDHAAAFILGSKVEDWFEGLGAILFVLVFILSIVLTERDS